MVTVDRVTMLWDVVKELVIVPLAIIELEEDVDRALDELGSVVEELD